MAGTPISRRTRDIQVKGSAMGPLEGAAQAGTRPNMGRSVVQRRADRDDARRAILEGPGAWLRQLACGTRPAGTSSSTLPTESAQERVRWVVRGQSLQVVARIREVEALVGDREVGHDRARQSQRQGGPVEPRGVHDLDPGEAPVRVDLDAVDDGAAPALDDADSASDAGRRLSTLRFAGS